MDEAVGQILSSTWQPLAAVLPALLTNLEELQIGEGWNQRQLLDLFLKPATDLIKQEQIQCVCNCGRHLLLHLGCPPPPTFPTSIPSLALCLDAKLRLRLLRLTGGVWAETELVTGFRDASQGREDAESLLVVDGKTGALLNLPLQKMSSSKGLAVECPVAGPNSESPPLLLDFTRERSRRSRRGSSFQMSSSKGLAVECPVAGPNSESPPLLLDFTRERSRRSRRGSSFQMSSSKGLAVECPVAGPNSESPPLLLDFTRERSRRSRRGSSFQMSSSKGLAVECPVAGPNSESPPLLLDFTRERSRRSRRGSSFQMSSSKGLAVECPVAGPNSESPPLLLDFTRERSRRSRRGSSFQMSSSKGLAVECPVAGPNSESPPLLLDFTRERSRRSRRGSSFQMSSSKGLAVECPVAGPNSESPPLLLDFTRERSRRSRRGSSFQMSSSKGLAVECPVAGPNSESPPLLLDFTRERSRRSRRGKGLKGRGFQPPKNISDVRADLVEAEIVSPPVTLPSGRYYGSALVELRPWPPHRPVSGEDLAQLLAYLHYAHCRTEGRPTSQLLLLIQASRQPHFRPAVLSALRFLQERESGVVGLTLFLTEPGERAEFADSDLPCQGKMIPAGDVLSELSGEEDERPSSSSPASAHSLTASLSPAAGGTRSPSGPRYTAFRRSLDAVLRACRSLGDAYVALYKDLKGGPAAPAALWSMDPAQLRDMAEAFREQLEAISGSDALRLLRHEGDERIASLATDYPDYLHIECYSLAVRKAEGLYAELVKVMEKTPEKVAGRLRLLEAFADAATFRLQARDLLEWMESEVGVRLRQMESEASVSLFRLRVQERQFESFFGPAQERLKAAEALVLQSQALWEPTHDSHSPLTDEQREEVKRDWDRLLEKVEETSSRLFAFRNSLADSLVAHQMLEKVYDWALHNAKWSSRIGLFLASQSPENSETEEGGRAQDPDDEGLGTLDEMRRSVRRQLERYPSSELTQLPLYAQRLADPKVAAQVSSLNTRCQDAHHCLLTHAQKLDKLASGGQDASQVPRCPSPTSTVYEEPRSRQIRDDDAFFARRRSYAGTAASSIWEVESVFPPPALAEEAEDETFSGPGAITNDLTNQVVSSMGDQTLRKRLAERKASRELMVPILPMPTATLCPDLERPRPGSARFSRCKRPLAKLMKRSTTADTMMASPPPVLPSSPPEALTCSGPSPPNGSGPRKFASLQSLSSEESLGCLSGSSASQLKAGSDFPDIASLSQELPALPPPFRLATPPPFTSPDQRILHNIISELVDTEFAYVQSLHYIIENYVPELSREDLPQELRGQRYTIFGNVERIYAFHVHHFLPQLKAKLGRGRDPDSLCLEVGRVFLENQTRFHLYALYNKNKPKSDALMSEVGTVFFRTRQLVLGDAMDLGSYLLKPVQRMAKYALLLAQLLKGCPPDDQESLDVLRRAEEMVTFQLRHGNHLLAMDLIRGCDLNLKEQGMLLRQDELEVWSASSGIVAGLGRSKTVRRVFLFEHLILFAKAHRCSGNPVSDEAYHYKFSLRLSDIGLTESLSGSERRWELWLRRRGSRQAFVLQAQSNTLKEAWVQDIREILWRQAKANRAQRKSEASCMGIRDSGVDLAASVDRIESRSVSAAHLMSLAGKGGGRAEGKRPHSLVSLSGSSSASSSSASSAGSVASAFPAVVFRHQHPPLPEVEEGGLDGGETEGLDFSDRESVLV